MYIGQQTAQAIVDEIGAQIREHINFMDGKGYIVASTDASRIGTLHTGAKRVIEERLPELYITREMENATTKKGINLPITIQDEIVGVIGITGEKERVVGYGNIVRRMTEIMIEDSWNKDRKRYDRRIKYRFMEEWIARADSVYDRKFLERGRQLGIEVMKPRRVMVIGFARYTELSGTPEGQKRLEEMEASVRHMTEQENGILYLREPPRQICLIDRCDDHKMRQIAEQISHRIHEKYGERLEIGVDGGGDSLHIRERYDEAERAAESSGEKEIVFYRELFVELFVNDISDQAMEKYLKKLFWGMPAEEIENSMQLVEIFFDKNGSITQIAEALYMHKNTIQYKLKKLESISGKDIRTPEGAGIYYMALKFYKETKNKRDIWYR